MFVESEVGDLMETSLPHFDEILSGIKHSIPIFVVMPDHSSVNTPFKINPVESIRRMAEVREKEFTTIYIFQPTIRLVSPEGCLLPPFLIKNPSLIRKAFPSFVGRLQHVI